VDLNFSLGFQTTAVAGIRFWAPSENLFLYGVRIGEKKPRFHLGFALPKTSCNLNIRPRHFHLLTRAAAHIVRHGVVPIW
jgi:hypothetical protein